MTTLLLDPSPAPVPIDTAPPMDGDWAGPDCGGYGCPTATPTSPVLPTTPAELVIQATATPRPLVVPRADVPYLAWGAVVLLVTVALAAAVAGRRSRRGP